MNDIFETFKKYKILKNSKTKKICKEASNENLKKDYSQDFKILRMEF